MQVKNVVIFLFLFGFVAIWTLALRFIALISGWTRLAKRYSTKDRLNPYQGKKLRRKSGRLGGSSYKRVLILGANMQGVYISVNVLFRLFHPPLFIPWSEIEAEERDGVFMSFVTLKFTEVPNVALTIPAKVMAQLNELKAMNFL